MNTRSRACGTGCRSARRWHGQIGAARIATYLHARFPMLNLDNMVHNALDITIINSMHHQHFSSPSTSRAPRAGAFDAQMPHASRTLFPDCESPRTIPHALPFTPLIAHQLMQLAAQHFASDMHESPRVAQDSAFGSRMERRITLRARCFPIANRLAPSHMPFLLLHSLLTSLCSLLHSILRATCTRALARPKPISKQDGVRSRSARAAIACARRQRRSQARRAPMCEYLSACVAPRAPPAVGQRLLDARCMLLLLPPRGTHASGDGLRGPVKNAMGPSLFYRNTPSGHHEDCDLLAARCEPSTAACATP